jgi:mannitol-1-/sugar-/sorbitol-6-phosphatase
MEIACAALLLDADGTLVDSDAAVERTWREWAVEYEVDAEAVLRVCHGRRSEETIAQFLPAEQVESAVGRLDELELADLDDVVAYGGAAELLAGLDGAGPMPWAIVTSGSVPLVTARLRAAGLPRPEVLVTAEDVDAGKPDPACYRLAARKIGVPAGECVVIEDAPAGVLAGRAAGATVIAVTSTHRSEDLGAADVVVSSLRDITVRPGVLSTRPLL